METEIKMKKNNRQYWQFKKWFELVNKENNRK